MINTYFFGLPPSSCPVFMMMFSVIIHGNTCPSILRSPPMPPAQFGGIITIFFASLAMGSFDDALMIQLSAIMSPAGEPFMKFGDCWQHPDAPMDVKEDREHRVPSA